MYIKDILQIYRERTCSKDCAKCSACIISSHLHQQPYKVVRFINIPKHTLLLSPSIHTWIITHTIQLHGFLKVAKSSLSGSSSSTHHNSGPQGITKELNE